MPAPPTAALLLAIVLWAMPTLPPSPSPSPTSPLPMVTEIMLTLAFITSHSQSHHHPLQTPATHQTAAAATAAVADNHHDRILPARVL
ncbi:uncharacterized protein PG986_007900 [Apiospora aurea]|uniref:Secreted protein n=1 Tax=Apiospora aurea TaxID=335848 RepID=A0ABR1QE68_9PEZI